MQANVGAVDRAVRIVIGIVLLSLIVFTKGDLRWIGLVGVIPLGTALLGWCPLYSLLGIKTCGLQR